MAHYGAAPKGDWRQVRPSFISGFGGHGAGKAGHGGYGGKGAAGPMAQFGGWGEAGDAAGELEGAGDLGSELEDLGAIVAGEAEAEVAGGEAEAEAEELEAEAQADGEVEASPNAEEVLNFCLLNAVDEQSATDLMESPPEVQAMVIARGELAGARNPSAALHARIRDARKAFAAGSGGDQQVAEPASIEEVEDFIASNGVDEAAADALRELTPQDQRTVLERGDLSTARNASAALLARIRDLRGRGGGGGGGGGTGGGNGRRSGGYGGGGGGGNKPAAQTAGASWGGKGGGRDSGWGSGGGYDAAGSKDSAYGSGAGYGGKGGGREASWGSTWGYGAAGSKGNAYGSYGVYGGGSGGGGGSCGAGEAKGKWAPSLGGSQGTTGAKGAGDGAYGYGAGRWAEKEGHSALPAAYGGGKVGGGNSVGINVGGRNSAAINVMWITVGEGSPMVQQGLPATVPALEYQKGDNAFSSAAYLLSEIVGDVSTEVTIVHDPDWEQFPEISKAVKQAGGEENCHAVATCPAHSKWAVGLANGKKGREAACKLALSVAIACEDPAVAARLRRTYPDFAPLCVGPSAPRAGWSVPAGKGLAGKALLTNTAWAARRGGYGQPKPALEVVPPLEAEEAEAEALEVPPPRRRGVPVPSVHAPAVHWLTLPRGSKLLLEGLPQEAPVISHSKTFQETFSNAHTVLMEMVTGTKDFSLVHDPDWKIYPEVAEAMKQVGAEEGCFCVAMCPAQSVWGVGIGMGWKTRESAGKLALAVALAEVSGRTQELSDTYPDFGAVCAAGGLTEEPPPKRFRKGGW